MNRRSLIRCIALAPLATGASCERASSASGQADQLQPGHDPRDFGALADGKTLDTAAIQAAIDAAASSLGRVNLTSAAFLSGSLILRSGITFHIAPDATLLGSTDPAHYRTGRWPALLIADSATDLHLSGKGTIDGQGRELAENIVKLLRAGKLTDPPDRKRPSERHRPQLIEFNRCRRSSVRDLTLRDAACWVQTYRDCEDLVLEGLTVRSTAYWNNDGIDLYDCRRVGVRHCDIDCSDDAICLKSATPGKFCEDILVENCRLRASASAFKMGTSSHGGFRRITVRHLRIRDTYRSAVTIQSVDGGHIEDIDVSDIVAENTGNAFFIRIGQRVAGRAPGTIRNIRIRDLAITVPATAADTGYSHAGPPLKRPHNVIPASIVGLPGHPVENVTLENIRITMPGGASPTLAHIPLEEIHEMPDLPQRYPEFSMFGELPSWALFLRHTRGIVLRDSRFELKSPDFRPAVILDRAVDTELDRISLSPKSGRPQIAAHASPGLRILNPSPLLGRDDLRHWKTEPAAP
jgi:Glycosyl hydrolases family 28